jgi:hypothetical protein
MSQSRVIVGALLWLPPIRFARSDQASGEPGWHFIDLYPGIYKGKEIRPNNFRMPQLTYAQDHPGEDLPAFHFAFKVTPESRGPVGQ